jgi:hypothetical protein
MVCRRCTMCAGMQHHWIDDPPDVDPLPYTHVCKHCEVVGMWCEECETEGCATCDFEGVLLLTGIQRIEDDE